MIRFFRPKRAAPTERPPEAPGPGTPALPPGIRVYAIGDVHGQRDLLASVFAAIDRDLVENPTERSADILLGDYVDRGPDSRGVIDALLDRLASAAASEGRRSLVCLSGNHEALLLRFLSDPLSLLAWQANGARETLQSYGVAMPPRVTSAHCLPLAEAFRAALPRAHLDFLRFLSLSLTLGDYFFAHAGVRPGVPLDQQAPEDLLWIRDEFLRHEGPLPKVVVHGHTPVREPEMRANRINIDTGAFATRRLTCLVLDGEARRFLATSPP